MEVNLSGSAVYDGNAAISTNFDPMSSRESRDTAVRVADDVVCLGWVHPAVGHVWRWRWLSFGNTAKGVLDVIEGAREPLQSLFSITRRSFFAKTFEKLGQP
jgi:hypothetical protein